MDNTPYVNLAKDEQSFRTAYLVAGFIQEQLSQAEEEELEDWMLEDEKNADLFGELTSPEQSRHSCTGMRKRIPI